MTNVTERIKEGVNKAIQYLENGESVRNACRKAGISVTSLYHNTTPEQRDQAYQKYVSPSAAGLSSRGPGRSKKTRRKSISSDSSSDLVEQLRRDLEEANSYISKLEHKIVQTVVLNESRH